MLFGHLLKLSIVQWHPSAMSLYE